MNISTLAIVLRIYIYKYISKIKKLEEINIKYLIFPILIFLYYYCKYILLSKLHKRFYFYSTQTLLLNYPYLTGF